MEKHRYPHTIAAPDLGFNASLQTMYARPYRFSVLYSPALWPKADPQFGKCPKSCECLQTLHGNVVESRYNLTKTGSLSGQHMVHTSIAEDNNEICRLCSGALTRNGHPVTGADNGRTTPDAFDDKWRGLLFGTNDHMAEPIDADETVLRPFEEVNKPQPEVPFPAAAAPAVREHGSFMHKGGGRI